MAKLIGENINVGFGIENPAARGTAVTPQVWAPGKSPSTMTLDVKKTSIRETRGSGFNSTSSEIVQKMASGELEFYARSESLGYLLKSLLGTCTTTTVLSAYKKHAFTLQTGNAQFPTLSVGLAQAGSFQDYVYNNCMIKSLEFKAGTDDLVTCKASIVGKDEATHAAYTVAFVTTDHFFRPQDVSMKTASTVAGLGAASALAIRDLTLTIENGAKEQQFLGSLNPADVLVTTVGVKGEFTVDYEDATYHDAFTAGTTYAMEVIFNRSDIDLGTSNPPKLDIIIDAVTYEKMTEERKLDSVVTVKVSFEAHYSIANAKAIEVDLYNTVASYVNA